MATNGDAVDHAYERLARLIELRQPQSDRRLPSAAALSARVGVSRPIVLAALRRLADEGRVSLSVGAGGIWVLGGQAEGREQRQEWVRVHGETIASMAVLRRILEPGIARFVAERGMSDEMLREARALVAQMHAAPRSDEGLLVRLDSQFHSLMARSTGFVALAAQLEDCRAWISPMFEFVEWPEGRQDKSNQDHERLLAAIETRDAAAAEGVMVEHVELSVGLIHSELVAMGVELPASVVSAALSGTR